MGAFDWEEFDEMVELHWMGTDRDDDSTVNSCPQNGPHSLQRKPTNLQMMENDIYTFKFVR